MTRPRTIGFKPWRVALSIEGSAIAGRSAAALLEFPGFKRGPIELVAPPNANPTHPFATVHRYVGAKVTVVEGIRSTTYGQTLFDIAMDTDIFRVERAMDDGLLRKRVAGRDLKERLNFYHGSRRKGSPGSAHLSSNA